MVERALPQEQLMANTPATARAQDTQEQVVKRTLMNVRQEHLVVQTPSVQILLEVTPALVQLVMLEMLTLQMDVKVI